MKFYDREAELATLAETREIAFNDHSQMTAVMGRRRIGKTMLVQKSCEGSKMLYLFVARSTEATLCCNFSKTIREELGIFVPDGISSIVQLFELLMQAGREHRFTLFFDEFQEFYKINPSIYSGIQDVWDRYKDMTHVNFVAGGSVQTLMHKVFMDYGEPLYGRCDSVLRLTPFSPKWIKTILADHYPQYSNDDLLALYTISGGVPKYIDYLMTRRCYTVNSIIDAVIRENSLFIEEGNILLLQEFGRDYGAYYSVLEAIANGRNTNDDISVSMGIPNAGGYLDRLESDYGLIRKCRPVGAKKGSQTVRYEIADNFLMFWFRYFIKHQDYIQSGLFRDLADKVKADYPTYSGFTLERYFRESLREKHRYLQIGGWWEAPTKRNGGQQNEIDIVAIDKNGAELLAAEVKRQRKNYHHEAFIKKIQRLQTVFPSLSINHTCLTLDDM